MHTSIYLLISHARLLPSRRHVITTGTPVHLTFINSGIHVSDVTRCSHSSAAPARSRQHLCVRVAAVAHSSCSSCSFDFDQSCIDRSHLYSTITTCLPTPQFQLPKRLHAETLGLAFHVDPLDLECLDAAKPGDDEEGEAKGEGAIARRGGGAWMEGAALEEIALQVTNSHTTALMRTGGVCHHEGVGLPLRRGHAPSLRHRYVRPDMRDPICESRCGEETVCLGRAGGGVCWNEGGVVSRTREVFLVKNKRGVCQGQERCVLSRSPYERRPP